jgi:hypothetical protein
MLNLSPTHTTARQVSAIVYQVGREIYVIAGNLVYQIAKTMGHVYVMVLVDVQMIGEVRQTAVVKPR